MKSYILAVATITIIWQPACVGMLSNTTKPTLESLLSTAAISNDICKNTFRDTTMPVQNDVITKYLLVKHVMKDNGLHFLSINTPLKKNKPTVDLKTMQSLSTQTIEHEIMRSESTRTIVFHPISHFTANYDYDSRMWGSGSLHNTFPAFNSCGKSRKLRTPDHQRRERKANHENSQKEDDAINAVVNSLKLHPDLPAIVALDTFTK